MTDARTPFRRPVVSGLVAAALAPGGCAAAVGSPSAEPTASNNGGGQNPISGPSCHVTVQDTGGGYITRSSGNASSRVSTTDAGTSVACGGGAPLTIKLVDGAVEFGADGDTTRVASGSTGSVGTYQVSVEKGSASAATFTLQAG